MMADIVVQMRDTAKWLRGSWKSTHCATGDLMDAGADEIERLRAILERCLEVIEFAYMNAPEQPKEIAEARDVLGYEQKARQEERK